MRIFILVVGAGLLFSVSARAQDAVAGGKVFVQCKTCHQIGPTAKNGVGPELNGLFGRKAGSVEGYSYSAANKNSGIDIVAFLKQFDASGKKAEIAPAGRQLAKVQ